jgi:pimeloyl-ACP methyl ester carboxylesterase
MKRILLAIILLATTAKAFAQTMDDYDTVVSRFQNFYNHNQPDSIFNLFGDRIKVQLTMDKTTDMITRLSGEFGEMKAHEFSYKDDHFYYYLTNFSNGVMMLAVGLSEANKLQNFRFMPYHDSSTSNFVLRTATGNIYGTLTLPDGNKKVPVVLIIAGSGPTDRDGNCPSVGLNANTYRLIADSLKDAGIASVRYDKRGIGESGKAIKNEEDLRFEDMVKDAEGFIKRLKGDPHFTRVIVLGHSEGSLTGMLAANKEKAAACISVSGIGERADKILVQQISRQSEELAVKSRIILDSLVKGYTVKDIDPTLTSLFRPSVQPYMISWLKYDPKQEIKKLDMPVLIIQGTTDIQVGKEEAEKLKKAAPKTTLSIVPGMNHVLKQAPENVKENVSTYNNPSLPLCPGFMTDILKFINGVR